jgi:hypothetical protein
MLAASTTLSTIKDSLSLVLAAGIILLPLILSYILYSTAYHARETHPLAQPSTVPDSWEAFLDTRPDLKAMTVVAGPLPAYYYRDWQHREPDFLPEPGVLALLTGARGSNVVFLATGEAGIVLNILLEDIHYLGRASAHIYQWYGISLYGPGYGGWQIYTFGLSKQPEFLKLLQQVSGLTIAAHQDLGPVEAQSYRQDVYGVWWPGEDCRIYLAPDRLLYDWHTSILLDHIRELTLMPVPKTHWPVNKLLRITYLREGEGLQTVGYVLPPDQAEQWGATLRERTQVPLEIVEGRKKKNAVEEGK